uniref:MFS domain-containing protein n=1 Tax=Syphacia muris TaxID=451379 RepID=A0A158R4Y9_9BILA
MISTDSSDLQTNYVHERLTAQNSTDRPRTELLPEVSPLEEEKRMLRKGRSLGALLFGRRPKLLRDGGMGIGEASVHHALVVIFLEYFAWGLLTVPVINVLADTFPANKFLMNGLILGIKGFLSFLSAPLIGALSDTWGRKSFLLLTVFCTCMPIPCLKISPWWYFALFSISGLFSVTFSVILAYVADVTEKTDRSAAYGLVSATFAASLVTSPALGAWISESWGDEAVVMLATVVATLDVLFILVAVPESLPLRLRHSLESMSWQAADPFGTLRYIWDDRLVLQLAVIVFLSYLPEAGQFSSLVGILSVVAQTGVLLVLTRTIGTKHTITLGLCFQCAQLMWYGLASSYWVMWAAGLLAAMSQLTYPSVSAFVSIQSDRDRQGTVQGVVNGIRGLCQGLGPALFGFIFYQFNMDLNVDSDETGHVGIVQFPAPRIRPQYISTLYSKRNFTTTPKPSVNVHYWIPGPPFLFGALMVLFALLINSYLPDMSSQGKLFRRGSTTLHSRQSSDTARLLHSSS